MFRGFLIHAGVTAGLAVSLAMPVPASASCVSWLLGTVRGLVERRVVPREVREFDAQTFEAELVKASQALAGGGTPELSPFPTLEEQMAFVQAHCGRAGTPGLALDQMLCDAGMSKRRALAKIFERAQLGRSFTGRPASTVARIERLVSDLYRFQHGDDLRALGLFEGRWDILTLNDRDPRGQRLLSRAVAEALAKLGLSEALERLGRVGSETRREALRRLFRDPRTKVVFGALVNALNATSLVPSPFLPSVRWVNLPDEALVDVLERGFDAAWPDLYANYGASLGRQETYETTLRRATNLATMIVLSVVVYGQYVEFADRRAAAAEAQANDMIEKLDRITEKIRESNARQASAPSLGDELFAEWKRRYVAKHGREPDPASAEYKEAHRIFVESAR